MTIKQQANLFKALGDENRIQILQLLIDGEKCACKILEAMHITQPTLSHHMKILTECGIVNSTKSGKWIHYSISNDGFDDAIEVLNSLKCTAPEVKCRCC